MSGIINGVTSEYDIPNVGYQPKDYHNEIKTNESLKEWVDKHPEWNTDSNSNKCEEVSPNYKALYENMLEEYKIATVKIQELETTIKQLARLLK